MIENPRKITVTQDKSQLAELGRALSVLREHNETEIPDENEAPILNESMRRICVFIGEFLDEADRVPGNETDDWKPEGFDQGNETDDWKPEGFDQRRAASEVAAQGPAPGAVAVQRRHRHTWGPDGQCTTLGCTARPRPRKGKSQVEQPEISDAD